VIAHRACPRHAPENSLAGIAAAARLGADVVELDVRLTRDGVPVLLHDPLLYRTTGRVVPVSRVSAATLRTYLLRGSDGEPPPTLDAALRALPDDLGAALDLKDPAAAPVALEVIDRLDRREAVRLWSQHERAVRWCAAKIDRSRTEVALLRDTHRGEATDRLLDDAVAWGASAVSVAPAVVDEPLLDAAHRRGLSVHAWFPRLEDQVEAVTASGLDGVVSDWVEEAVAAGRLLEAPSG
jgi:glycerophosphoryl diester phosphodiesterase